MDNMKNGIYLPIMEQHNGKLQQSDAEPEHLLILVHGILSKYVPLPHSVEQNGCKTRFTGSIYANLVL